MLYFEMCKLRFLPPSRRHLRAIQRWLSGPVHRRRVDMKLFIALVCFYPEMKHLKTEEDIKTALQNLNMAI